MEKKRENSNFFELDLVTEREHRVSSTAAAALQRVLNSTYSMSLSANGSFVVHMDRPAPNEVLASPRMVHDLISSFCNAFV